MSAGGCLFSVALGFIGAGADHVIATPHKLRGLAIVALGVGAMVAAWALISKGV